MRWGIISTGGIASAFADALNYLDDETIVAVGSRSQASADRFGDKFNIPNRYNTYEALVNDADVDIVYIATPHVFHHDNMMLALNAGKHVLCEKPLTINATEAEACIKLAREKNLFLMEAVWMRFIPAIVQIREWIVEGVIGDVLQVYANFNVKLDSDPKGRIYNPALGGGALLDVGIYPISFATMILGLPDTVHSHVKMSDTGVDEQESIIFGYTGGQSALLGAGVNANTRNEAIIKGSTGYIVVDHEFFHPTVVTVVSDENGTKTHQIPYESNGLNYEAAAVSAAIQAGKTEIDVMSLDETLAVMRLMDGLRADWGFAYPHE